MSIFGYISDIWCGADNMILGPLASSYMVNIIQYIYDICECDGFIICEYNIYYNMAWLGKLHGVWPF